MSDERPTILIRPAREEDESFIISSFLQSYRLEGRNEHMSNAVYYGHYTRAAVAQARGTVHVAANPDDPWQIMGWLAVDRARAPESDPPRVTYGYVKSPWRRLGIFTKLVEHVNPRGAPMVVTRTGRLFLALRARFAFTFEPGDSE